VELKHKYDTQCTEISYIFNTFGILTPPLHTSLRIAENREYVGGLQHITVPGYSVCWRIHRRKLALLFAEARCAFGRNVNMQTQKVGVKQNALRLTQTCSKCAQSQVSNFNTALSWSCCHYWQVYGITQEEEQPTFLVARTEGQFWKTNW
jgi:hypothetical protein